ncbi:MAG: helicase, partial [Actinobacteria bacterium]|nr:helicase [Actinomycetota bacterium]
MLARWSGWGALPAVFDPAHTEHDIVRAELAELLGPAGYRAASRTTLNAHYTDAALADAVWDALVAGGFAGGRVLEPGCGAGTFLGLAPAATELIGVELDPTTAAIAAALYPAADIRAESFADTRLPVGSVDLTIGNVPFAKIALHDPVFNAGRHSMHNHFILKALHLTRPGGVVAVLTSHWTLDATNPAARREMACLAELVTAIRLPSSAHTKAAGTRVLTDLLVLRRHPTGTEPPVGGGGVGWERALPHPVAGPADSPVAGRSDGEGPGRSQPPSINEVFLAQPKWVIGDVAVRNGQYGPALDVRFDGELGTELRGRLQQALAGAGSQRPGWSLFTAPDSTEALANARVLRPDAPTELADQHLAVDDAGGFTMVSGGRLQPHPVPLSQAREMTSLLGLRDTTVALLSAEAADGQDTPELAVLRAQLNERYDAYIARYGPINRVRLRRTGRIDPDSGVERMARIRPPQGGFRADPHSPAVYALEHYDATTDTARKATILSGRVIAPRAPRLGADTAADAVAICLDSHGELRLAEIARLLGQDSSSARQALTGLVFNDPQQAGRLVPAAEYLSGNVRVKLRAAEQAAAQAAPGDAGGEGAGPQPHRPGPAVEPQPDWQTNIDALRAVVPPDLTPAEIDARLGASWIGADVIQAFLRQTLDDPSVQVENPGGSVWAVKGARHSVLATSTYGTARLPAIDLAQAVLEQRQIRITDELDDGSRVLNLTDTVAAQDKAGLLAETFADWLWTAPDRAQHLTRVYNDTFNAIVLRHYDGSAAQLPGLAVTFTPHPHQLAAVARIVSEPAVLLAHDVGAGKTASMIIGAMELRRLQLAGKPAVVVPNHMLEQFTREWMQLYPQAQVLAAGTEDLAGSKRRLLVARVATGDWDAVLLSRSAFERLPLHPATQQAYLDSQLEQLRTQLDRSRSGSGLTVKRLEASLARAEERLEALTDSARDPGVSFEQTGIDYLIIDEAHGYKNLRTASNIPGVAIDGSQRASDLDMKISYLRGRHGARVATFATATPIANSVSEAYVMQRYLRPDVLTDAGITDFDTWAATFGEVTTTLELSPDGSNYRMQSRFAKFRNVPEL